MTKTWVPTTTTGLITEIQRLAKTYLGKKYTKVELEEKYNLGVSYYKNQCKEYGYKVDIGVSKQRGNKVLYAILETVKNQIRQEQKGAEQMKLW